MEYMLSIDWSYLMLCYTSLNFKLNLSLDIGGTNLIRRNQLYSITFLLAGFNIAALYMPFLIMAFIYDFKKVAKAKISKEYLLTTFYFVLFVLSVFIIGYYNLYMYDPYKILIIMMVECLFLGSTLQSEDYNTAQKYFIWYIIGVLSQSIAIVFFSFTSDELYGYGKLIDPFSNEIINSPAVSNILSICTVVFTYTLFSTKSIKNKTITSIVIAILIMAGLFLAGRSFFIISIVGFFYILIKKSTIKTTFYTVSIFAIIFMSTITIIGAEIDSYFSFASDRFSHGLESNRFKHASHWISIITEHPLGGFSVDSSIEETNWYHNIFMDSSRVAGWIPLASLFIYISFIIYTSNFKKNTFDITLPFIVFIVTILISLQDVIIEGNYRVLIIMFFSGALICNKNTKKKFDV